MKRFIAFGFSLLFVSCAASSPAEVEVNSPSSTPQEEQASSLEAFDPSVYSQDNFYMGPLRKAMGYDDEFLGTITVKGYPTFTEVCDDASYGPPPCQKWATYAYLNITEGLTPILQEYLGTTRKGLIGLGCKAFLESNEDTALILTATAESPVAITLNNPYNFPDIGMGGCTSYFRIISVTRS